MTAREKINYIEFSASDIAATKAFFEAAFGWDFVDYGPEYTSFSDAGFSGGFYHSPLMASTDQGSALVVLLSDDLEETQARVERAGGKVVKPIFSFPGGRRFHFTEPSGNELAVWSEGEG